MQALISRYYQAIFTSMIVVLLGLSFYVGFLAGKSTPSQQVALFCKDNILSKLSIPLEKLSQTSTANASSTTDATTGRQSGNYVGSKNGTKYYSSPSCSGAKRIKPANYIWFDTAEDARIQGFTPGTC